MVEVETWGRASGVQVNLCEERNSLHLRDSTIPSRDEEPAVSRGKESPGWPLFSDPLQKQEPGTPADRGPVVPKIAPKTALANKPGSSHHCSPSPTVSGSDNIESEKKRASGGGTTPQPWVPPCHFVRGQEDAGRCIDVSTAY